MKTYDKFAEDALVTEEEIGIPAWEDLYYDWNDDYCTSYCGDRDCWSCGEEYKRRNSYSACGVDGCCMQYRKEALSVEEMEGREFTFDHLDSLVRMWFDQQIEDDMQWWGNIVLWMVFF